MLLASPQRCDTRHFAIASYETNRKINFSVLLFLNMIVWNWFKLKKSWYFLWRVHKISTDTTFIVRFFSCKTCLTLILESWKKNQKRGTITESVLRKKIQSAGCAAQHWEDLYMFLCFGFFFQKTRSATVPKNGIYFCSARHISSRIGICHLKLTP